MISTHAFFSELQKIAATTVHIPFTPIHGRALDKDFDHLVMKGENQDGLHICHMLVDDHYKEKGPAATVSLLRGPEINSWKLWEVRMMHVRDDLRGKGTGKKVWNAIREAHPDGMFGVLPDPVKDKAVSRDDLHKVYESYGFRPNRENSEWMYTIGDGHPTFKEELRSYLAKKELKRE